MEYLSPRDGGPLRRDGVANPYERARMACSMLCVAAISMVSIFSATLHASPVPVVRVMVDREKAALKMYGFDLVLRHADNDRRVAMAEGRSAVGVTCSLGGKITVELGGRRLPLPGPLHVTSLGGFIRVGASQYRDDLYVYSFNGDCIVINHVDLEKYVAGLLNSEMSASWSLNTLMAQAVAARSYALHQMKEASSPRYRGLLPPFDVEGTVRDQVYEGAHQERYRALRAVQRTRGVVLSYQGAPIKAFYHSTCGGKTELPEKVWGARLPYLRAVTCGFCERSPRFNWTYSFSNAELESRLRAQGLLKGKLVSVKIRSRNQLGRADKIEVTGTGGVTIVAATKLRDLAGTGNVRSTAFNLASDRNAVVFIGHGSGHGVGMCQWGAKTMGDRGQSYAQILKHYYPAAELTRLY